MCGFFAEYRKGNTLFEKKLFLSNASKINHRGPDSQGSIFFKNFSAKFFRLSILDLTNKGDQPMVSKDGRFVILFNGEIYNYKKLRKMYNLKTLSNTDSEVILLLFEKFGLDMAHKLEGMFSILIYDQSKNTCYFLRDRFGIKPLYYLNINSKILFSSEIKPLLNYTKKKINKKITMDFFLKQSMDHNQDTFFENIKSIPPGSYGIVRQSKFKILRYWSFSKIKKSKNLQSARKRINKLFSCSIKNHLVSDRKIGFFFSGGTDSLSIISKVKLFKNNPRLFTYKFLSKNGKVYGEHDKAKLIAKDLNLKIDVTTIKPEDIIKNFDKVINACEAPITSIRQIADYLMFQRFRELKIPVAIIGHGGDELLGGYDYNFLNYLKDKYRRNLSTNKFINDLLKYLNLKGKTKIEKEKIILNYLVTLTFQEGSNKDCTPFVEVDNFSKEFLDNYISENYYHTTNNKIFNSLQNSQLKDINSISLPRNLRSCDRLSMAHGIEARVPFLDHNLANFLFNLDNDFKFKDLQTRWIFKSIFLKQTSKYFSLRKNSVPDPQSIWLKKDLKEFFMDEFKSLKFKRNIFFDVKNITKKLDLFHNGKLESSFNLFQIFSFQKFLNKFKI